MIDNRITMSDTLLSGLSIYQKYKMKRSLQVAIISDVHLGSYGCFAKELVQYLKSIQPDMLIINGDLFDLSHLKKRFPTDHFNVIKEILNMSEAGTKVYLITGNFDDFLRPYADFASGNIFLRNKIVFHINGAQYWVFHGDVFDASLKISSLLARFGGRGYRLLTSINRFINTIRLKMGYSRISLAEKIRKGLPRAQDFIHQFEQAAITQAHKKGYEYVICGHSHCPAIKDQVMEDGTKVTYMNAGDWVENLTALEMRFGKWSLYEYDSLDYNYSNPKLAVPNLSSKLTNTENQDTILSEVLGK